MALSKEENEMLTRVGPGTPAGEMLRRYWQPIGLGRSFKTNRSGDASSVKTWSCFVTIEAGLEC